MSRYIDADKAIKDYAHYGIKHFYDATDLEAILNECPAADVVEVVRCYQCKYHTTDDECTHPHWDKDELIICPEALDMDYCSYGEKRND